MFSLILKCLQENNLPIEHLRGHSYDGASNMAGQLKGVKTSIQEVQPLSH